MIPAALGGLGTLEVIETWIAPCRLASPVSSSRHDHRERRIGFVRIRCSEGEGFGEIAAMDEVVGQDPTLGAVLDGIEHQWAPRLFEAARARGGACPPSHAVAVLGGSSAVDRQAAAAIEMALLDAELRGAGLSLAQWLEVSEPAVPYGALLGIPGDHQVAPYVERALSLFERGATRLRMKVDPTWSAAPVRALRDAAPDALLQADANGSLSGPEGWACLEALDALGLACVEEPLGTSDLAAYAVASASLATPLCLDESLTSPRVVRDALRYEACGVLCIKPGRLGGVRAALRSLEDAVAGGVDGFIGGMFEAGLGRSVLGVLASHPGATLVSDVAGASTYLAEDPCGQEAPIGRAQPLHRGGGVGPWPDLGKLDARWEVSASAL